MDDFDGGSYDGGVESDITVDRSDEADIGATSVEEASITEAEPTKEADIGDKTTTDAVEIGSTNKDEASIGKTEGDEAVTRELNDDERQGIKENLGWSDKKIDNKCRIDENGTIHYKTDRHDLEGKTNEVGVPYERKTVEYNGQKIEGVFPVFDSKYDAQIDPSDYDKSHTAHERICNTQLAEAIEKDPEVAGKFNAEQLEQIKNRETPDGFTWHHNEEPGKMQLVERAKHDKTMGGTAHTGGNSLWGNKSRDTEDKPAGSHKNKGESF